MKSNRLRLFAFVILASFFIAPDMDAMLWEFGMQVTLEGQEYAARYVRLYRVSDVNLGILTPFRACTTGTAEG